MEWDYTTNLPVEGSYQRHGFDGKKIRDYVEECISDEEYTALWDSVEWDLYEFILKKLEKTIPKYEDFMLQLIGPFNDKISDYVFDILVGYLWMDLPDGYTWGGVPTPIGLTDVYRRLFFCDTDEDVFALFADLPQEIQSNLLKCYAGLVEDDGDNPVRIVDPDKGARFTRYLLARNSK